jgi:hypothetical protein
MIEPPDLQVEAIKTLEEFASRCDGRAKGEVYDAFIAITARVLNAAAVLLHADDPDHPDCPLCRATKCASDAAHVLARIAANGEKVH